MNIIKQLAATMVLMLAPIMLSPALAQDQIESFDMDGLELVENSRVGLAYINPEADFSVFKRVAILDTYVSFRSNWRRDQNRGRTGNVSQRDMERIRADVAELFRQVFAERLEAAGFEVVDMANSDVLLLRPAIVNLDVSAPDTRSAGRTTTFSAETGSATMYMQLMDSLSGEIIGRAADQRTIRSGGGWVSRSNRVTNSADARRLFGTWADKLVEFLDSHYK